MIGSEQLLPLTEYLSAVEAVRVKYAAHLFELLSVIDPDRIGDAYRCAVTDGDTAAAALMKNHGIASTRALDVNLIRDHLKMRGVRLDS